MKAAFVYLTITLCFIGLVLYSNQPDRLKSKAHHNLHAGRRLVVRKLHVSPDAKHENVAFDPVIARLERKREDRTWEKEHFEKQYKEWAHDSSTEGTHDNAPHPESQPEPTDWDYKDPEDYLNDEDQFNISSRILVLFPLIDNHPPDGRISLGELQDWHLQAAMTEANHRVAREMETFDKNHDGMISFAEYSPHSTAEDLANQTIEHGGVGWWKEQFDAADEDGDGLLNVTEFGNFLHPQDSHNPKLHQWLRQQEIRDRDTDKDGKLTYTEFERGMYDLISLRTEEEDSATLNDHHTSARREVHSKQKFSELDKNKDGQVTTISKFVCLRADTCMQSLFYFTIKQNSLFKGQSATSEGYDKRNFKGWRESKKVLIFLTEDELVPVMENLRPSEAFYANQQTRYLIMQADENKDDHLTIEEMLQNPYIFYSTAYAYEDYEEYMHDEF